MRCFEAHRSNTPPGYQPGLTGTIVHVVDDDDSDRRRLCSLLGTMGLETRGHTSIEAFLDADRPDVPGCLVVDASLPRPSETRLNPEIRAIVVTAARADVPMAVRAMKAGAIDFLEKPLHEADVLAAIAAAVDVDRGRRLAETRRFDLAERFATLTRREREVMALVTAGRMNKQAAGDLGLSEITVKVHRGSVMRKMRARTLADLVRMADAVIVPEKAAA